MLLIFCRLGSGSEYGMKYGIIDIAFPIIGDIRVPCHETKGIYLNIQRERGKAKILKENGANK